MLFLKNLPENSFMVHLSADLSLERSIVRRMERSAEV